MKITAEISLYPLNEAYIDAIDAFIATLHAQQALRIATSATSTQVSGDQHAVFSAVQQGLEASYEKFGAQVLVCKFIPGEREVGQWRD